MTRFSQHKYRIYILGIIVTISILSLIGMNIILQANNHELKTARNQALSSIAAKKIYLELEFIIQHHDRWGAEHQRYKINHFFVKENLLALKVIANNNQTLFAKTMVSLPQEIAFEMTPGSLQAHMPDPEEVRLTPYELKQPSHPLVLLGRAVIYSSDLKPDFFLFFLLDDPQPPVMDSYEQLVILCQTIFILTLLVLIWTFIRKLVRPYESLLKEIKSASAIGSKPAESSAEMPDEITFLVESFKGVISKLQEKEKLLEIMHQQAQQRADSKEKFARDIFAGLRLGVISLEETGRFLDCNPAMEVLLGRKKIAFKNLSYTDIFQQNPAIQNVVESFYQDRRPVSEESVPMVSASGDELLVDVDLSPLTDPHGVFYGVICVLENVTEANTLRRRLQIQENLAALGEMSAGIAHEFKNSLTTISGYAQMLHGNARPGAEVRRTAALVQEVEEMVKVISDFLEYARPMRAEKSRLDLDTLISEVTSTFQERYPDITFNTQLIACSIAGEKALLKKAFQNLILNSVQALEDSKQNRKKQVDIRMEFLTGNMLRIHLSDTGPGTDQNTLSRIFTPFFTTRPQGTGMGLAVVQKIITAHEGSITVWSEPGKGFTTEVKLPASPETSPQSPH